MLYKLWLRISSIEHLQQNRSCSNSAFRLFLLRSIFSNDYWNFGDTYFSPKISISPGNGRIRSVSRTGSGSNIRYQSILPVLSGLGGDFNSAASTSNTTHGDNCVLSAVTVIASVQNPPVCKAYLFRSDRRFWRSFSRSL